MPFLEHTRTTRPDTAGRLAMPFQKLNVLGLRNRSQPTLSDLQREHTMRGQVAARQASSLHATCSCSSHRLTVLVQRPKPRLALPFDPLHLNNTPRQRGIARASSDAADGDLSKYV